MSNHPIEIDDAVVLSTPSKAKASEIVDRLVNAVEIGHLDPLQLLVKLRFAESIIKATIEHIQPYAIDDASKYNRGEQITILGAELKVKEAGTKYDYSNCGDKAYEMYDFEESKAKEGKKSRADFLKSLKQSMTIVDEETGEIHQIHPPIKTSSTIVQVTIK